MKRTAARYLPANPLFSGTDLKRLILPLVIEQILAITVGMADTMMISSVGEAAVSGVSLVDMVNVVIINIFAAMATGGAVVTSQLIGARRQDEARASAGQLLLLCAALALAVMGLTLLFKRPLLRLFFGSIEQDVMDNALTYLFYSALSFPFLAVYNACAALFRSKGNSKISMQVSALMNILNLAGNALLIFVFHLGVAGAAISTLFSRIVAAGIMLVLVTRPTDMLYVERKFPRPDFGLMRRILRIGVPSGLENSFFQLGRVLVVSMIALFGTVQIAANAVANNIDALGCIPGQAMNLAIITGCRTLRGRRRLAASSLLHQKTAENHLSLHDSPQHRLATFAAVAAEHLPAFRRDAATGIYSHFHPQRLCYAAVAVVFHAAKRPARGKRRAVHHGRFHFFHGGVPYCLQLYIMCILRLGRGGRMDCHGDGLAVPRDVVYMAHEIR